MNEDLKTVAHVDLQRYLGTWFEIARKPMRFEDATARDITATYERDGDAVRVVNSCIDADGKVDVAVGQARPVDASNAKLEVTFLPQGLRWIPFAKGDYWILRVDDEYRTALVGEPGRKYLWLLHRTPRMDFAAKHEWLEFARMRGYDLGDVIYPSQSGQVHREAEAAD
ncbi:lipocalin family protein [Pseudoluteimonas lycopersici]|uniref:Outer membrane lipoprotein Blc n=2 Tax=Pseudoluteimonas lycopersici TaxID=1324796 RepID=A0A516V749_9GAMM|nr:lipocalin family protein [Lysobacter lycopersici]